MLPTKGNGMKHLRLQLAIATSLLALAACDRFQAPSSQPHGSVSAMALAYMQKDDPDGYNRAKGLADPLSDREVEFYAGWPKLKHRLAPDTTDNGCTTNAKPDDGLGQFKATVAAMSAAEAEGYIVKSANAGYARAQAVVANLIDHGAVPDGLTGDDQSALAWMTKAANQNDDEAQFQLGEYYQSGRYADRDVAQAVTWYGKAADQGNVRAMVALADLYMDGNQVQRDTDRAMDLYRKAADADSEKAEVALGAAYYDGKVVTKDYGQSARYQASAAYNLGIMYEKGQGVPQDYAKAAEAFEMGVKKGDTSSAEELAKLYDNGQGVEKDTVKARELYCRTNDRFNCLRLKMFGGSSKPQASEAAD